jgi:hypothetical protein
MGLVQKGFRRNSGVFVKEIVEEAVDLIVHGKAVPEPWEVPNV